MAMAVEKGLALESRGFEFSRLLLKKLGEAECLLREALSTFVVREEVDEFIAEDGDTTWLQSDDWNTGFDFESQGIENLEEQVFGAVEHAEVIERTAATEILFGD
jgi:hypothetical protein